MLGSSRVAGEQLGNAVPLLHGHGAAVDKDIADAELSAAGGHASLMDAGPWAAGGIRCARDVAVGQSLRSSTVKVLSCVRSSLSAACAPWHKEAHRPPRRGRPPRPAPIRPEHGLRDPPAIKRRGDRAELPLGGSTVPKRNRRLAHGLNQLDRVTLLIGGRRKRWSADREQHGDNQQPGQRCPACVRP